MSIVGQSEYTLFYTTDLRLCNIASDHRNAYTAHVRDAAARLHCNQYRHRSRASISWVLPGLVYAAPSDGRAYNFCCGDLWRRCQPLRAFPLGTPSNRASLASEGQLQRIRLHVVSRPCLIILGHHSSSTSHGTMHSRNAGNLIGHRSESRSKVRCGRRACCA